ncbi:hypothetical protein ACJ73_02391 [Blastomyces percursus]|uniref:Uncharacterized protein n=1 Tax=Blastomyces percursus TaxID=1658174 RepID=A0A1J9QBK9_9EURO|nr:hypothetical protein ACJ73_02391 [Blastomyces percursus]
MATSSSCLPPVSQLRVPVHKLPLRPRGFSRPVPLPGREIVAPAPHHGPSGVDPGPTADQVHLADVVQTVDGLRRQVEQIIETPVFYATALRSFWPNYPFARDAGGHIGKFIRLSTPRASPFPQ